MKRTTLRLISLWSVLFLSMFCLKQQQAWGQATAGRGFQVNRYEPTSAGEWSFMVDHPWYSNKPNLAIGLTLDYNHNPLYLADYNSVTGTFDKTQVAISHQLISHLDVAGSVLNRISVSASLPVVLFESGLPVGGITPIGGFLAGDPRFGIHLRLYGEPYQSPFSISLGGNLWIPIRSAYPQLGDYTTRVLPRLILGGLVAKKMLWSFTAGFYYRSDSSIGAAPPSVQNTYLNAMGSQVVFGGGLAYFDPVRNFSVGAETTYDTVVTNGSPFSMGSSHMELMAQAQYRLLGQLHLGAAVGAGFFYSAGAPDARALVRVAWTPKRKEPPPPAALVCKVQSDRDQDGVPDVQDMCPDVHQGPFPDPNRIGCPDGDQDKDGIPDLRDKCPTVPKGPYPAKDPITGEETGCPIPDRDQDGIIDSLDRCPDLAKGPKPEKDPRTGQETGCPAVENALIDLTSTEIVLKRSIQFAFNKAKLLPQSIPVLEAVRAVLAVRSDIRKLEIQGHTDGKGNDPFNMDLSKRRVGTVKQWLIQNGITSDRLNISWCGLRKPIQSNKTARGRYANRRVEFHIRARSAPDDSNVSIPVPGAGTDESLCETEKP